MHTMATQQNKIHPHKLLMYIAMGSITMMFAGWISAFMVRKAQGRWEQVHLPTVFWISTIAIILSSVTMFMAVRTFKRRRFADSRKLLLLTVLLGFAFLTLQIDGFYELYASGIALNRNNASGEFTYVIPILHGLHVLGGIVALLLIFIKSGIRRKKKVYSSIGLEIAGIYWHFVDILWVYIFIFFIISQN